MDSNNTLTDSRQLWNTDISDFRGENRIYGPAAVAATNSLVV